MGVFWRKKERGLEAALLERRFLAWLELITLVKNCGLSSRLIKTVYLGPAWVNVRGAAATDIHSQATEAR